MKIGNVEVIELAIPFSTGIGTGDPTGLLNWPQLDMVLVKVETDNGITGWGDAFAFGCRQPVAAALRHMIAPRVIGREAGDIAAINHELQVATHLFGRHGITTFAISGLDIALWDIVGKAAGRPLHALFGGNGARALPAYASLFRYFDPEHVADRVAAARAGGYRYIKLHEIRVPEVRAAREAAGPGVPIMVDTNCPWNFVEARAAARAFAEFDIHWLEEPIFPPDDFAALARLRAEGGIPIAAGENACTAMQFQQMIAAGAVDYAQPSVTKLGGITEFRKVASLCEAQAVQIMPHSPYFGPGFLATLHLAAALPRPGLIERIFLYPEAQLYPGLVDPRDGDYALPAGPGLGAEPDPAVIRDYAA